MPIALIVFQNKSHLNLDGSNGHYPFDFYDFLFQPRYPGKKRFLASIRLPSQPKLRWSKIKSRDSVIDEHTCLTAALDSLVQISKNGGIFMTMNGRQVTGKVWIHYVIGDIV